MRSDIYHSRQRCKKIFRQESERSFSAADSAEKGSSFILLQTGELLRKIWIL